MAFAIATLRRAFPTLPASAAVGPPCSCTMRVLDRRLVHGHDVDDRLGVRHPQCVAEVRPSNYMLRQCISPSGQWHPSWTYTIDAIATIDTVIAWLTVGHCYASGGAPLRAMLVLSPLPGPPWRDSHLGCPPPSVLRLKLVDGAYRAGCRRPFWSIEGWQRLVPGPEGISLPMQLKVPDDCERVSGTGMVESHWLYKIEIGRAEAA